MRSGIHEDAMRVIPRKWRGAGVALRTWASLPKPWEAVELLILACENVVAKRTVGLALGRYQ